MNSTLICSATSYEIAPFLTYLESHASKKNFSTYLLDGQEFQILVTGVGPILTAHGLAKFFNLTKPTRAIHIGIAGGQDDLQLGQVVQVVQDRFGDVGVEDEHGEFIDVFELELADQNFHPFREGSLHIPDNAYRLNDSIEKVAGVTLSKVTGTELSARRIRNKYNSKIETMESASFFYACLVDHIDFISIRGISNYIGIRNKQTWNIPLAIDKVNASLIELIQSV